MKILFVLPYIPSPIRVRPYHFIRNLIGRHEITVLAMSSDQEMRHAADLEVFCRRVEVVPHRGVTSVQSCLVASLRGEPLQAAVCRSPELERRLDSLLTEHRFDLVHVEHLRAAHLRARIPGSTPTVFDSVDCISLLLERSLRASASVRQRLVAALELHRTRMFEARMLPQFDRVAVTSAIDAQAQRTLAPSAQVTVIPNGVDLDYFRPSTASQEPATLVFSGKMSYHANVTAVLYFVREILPLIRRERPDVRLRIVGSTPPRAIQMLARDPAISVTGYVADMRRALAGATVAICPVTVKVGIQNKVLEAMAMGLPVVCTRAGAEGLAAERGRDLLVGDDPAEFAAEVCRLLADASVRERIGGAGRRYAEAFHRWDTAAAQLEALYREAAREAWPGSLVA